jgi:hypothetical protein
MLEILRGLVPVLARAAAADKAEVNRVAALADTLEPAAAAAIRDRLKDESQKVRLEAAGADKGTRSNW